MSGRIRGAQLKLVLLGDKDVGKTNIFKRYIYDNILRTDMVLGAYFALIKVKIKKRVYKVSIWDTAGEEKFNAITKIFTRGANCAVLCFDLTDRKTFSSIKKYAEILDKNCALIILGNKLELIENGEKERQVTVDQIKDIAKKFGALYSEVSAVTGAGIEAAFEDVICKYIATNGTPVDRVDLVSLCSDGLRGKKYCC